MPPRTILLAVHSTTTAGTTEAREVQPEYNADERRRIVPTGRRRPAAMVHVSACLVSWRMPRPEKTRTRTRARIVLLVERDSMTARVAF